MVESESILSKLKVNVKKKLKNQKKILIEIKHKLSDLKTKPNPHPELVTFLTDNFDAMLNECLSYLKLFHELTKKCASLFTNRTDDLITFQQQSIIESNERLSLIVKKVLSFIKVNSANM